MTALAAHPAPPKATESPKSFHHQENSRNPVKPVSPTPLNEAAETEERFLGFCADLRPTGALEETLVRRAAVLAVRLERSVAHEQAGTAQRIRQAETDFVGPEGLDAASIDRLKAEARALAGFDASREGTLARRHEAATERGFYKALKELRLVQKQARTQEGVESNESFEQELGSFFQRNREGDEREARYLDPHERTPVQAPHSPGQSPIAASSDHFDLPITIGRRC